MLHRYQKKTKAVAFVQNFCATEGFFIPLIFHRYTFTALYCKNYGCNSKKYKNMNKNLLNVVTFNSIINPYFFLEKYSLIKLSR